MANLNIKDAIFSTIEEFKDINKKELSNVKPFEISEKKSVNDLKENLNINNLSSKKDIDDTNFLLDTKEKILVLFEGLQDSSNEKIEEKLDITLNFLEYLLSKIEKKIDNLK